MIARRVAVALLALSVALGLIAWRLQADAARYLDQARAVNQATVPEDDSAPPRIADYRAILATLDRSIQIRTNIDGLLRQIETIVSQLRGRQDGARTVFRLTMSEVEVIGATLGGAADAAEASASKIRRLRTRLATSAALARRIARELEELDENCGPRIGGQP
jgi:hypothetical protein